MFYNYQRIAKHLRSLRPGNYSTVGDHMPSSHQAYSDWNPTYFELRASAVGVSAGEYTRRLITQYSYPELAYKQAQGILSLVKTYGPERLENACRRALAHERASYRTIKNILKNGLDAVDIEITETFHIPQHGNLRDASTLSALCTNSS